MKNFFSLQIKPVGSFCNLSCKYCYVNPFKTGSLEIMGENIWKKIIKECLNINPEPVITWHGGEAMIAGLDFYRKVYDFVELNKKTGQKVRQVIQTNATLVTEEFASFFKKARFEIGVSIDGPEHIHDMNRINLNGSGSFKSVMNGLKILRIAGLDPSVIVTVTSDTLRFSSEVFKFLVAQKFKSIKYSPVFDYSSNAFSITNEQWFHYLSIVLDEWVTNGDADISVLDLDEVIAWLDPNRSHPMCSSSQTCMRWVSIDPNGNMYPCAYFRSSLPYGNIITSSLKDVKNCQEYLRFKELFRDQPKKCRECEFFKVCGNGCPAIRVTGNQMDPKGVYVYCEERKKLFKKMRDSFS